MSEIQLVETVIIGTAGEKCLVQKFISPVQYDRVNNYNIAQ